MTNKDIKCPKHTTGGGPCYCGAINKDDMPDVIYAHKFTGDNCSGKWFDAEVYTANWTKCYSQSHIDKLTQQHEEELKAMRRVTIYECLELLNDKFSYDRVYELLNAGDV